MLAAALERTEAGQIAPLQPIQGVMASIRTTGAASNQSNQTHVVWLIGPRFALLFQDCQFAGNRYWRHQRAESRISP